MSARFILSLKYTAASPSAGKSLGGFLRYVQYRDHQQDVDRDEEVRGLLKYVAHRDRSAPSGRLFGRDGNVGDLERRELGAYITRATRNVGQSRKPERAAYRFVLSPEKADGLDLKALTRAAMDQLERDFGELPPWIAAIHRNTQHPHVHVVLAARRETASGRFRTIVITRARLARMKQALALDMDRQLSRSHPRRPATTMRTLFAQGHDGLPQPKRRRRGQLQAAVRRSVAVQLRQMARRYRRQLDQELLELEREREYERLQERQHGRSR